MLRWILLLAVIAGVLTALLLALGAGAEPAQPRSLQRGTQNGRGGGPEPRVPPKATSTVSSSSVSFDRRSTKRQSGESGET